MTTTRVVGYEGAIAAQISAFSGMSSPETETRVLSQLLDRKAD
jgi:hypothetical protein